MFTISVDSNPIFLLFILIFLEKGQVGHFGYLCVLLEPTLSHLFPSSLLQHVTLSFSPFLLKTLGHSHTHWFLWLLLGDEPKGHFLVNFRCWLLGVGNGLISEVFNLEKHILTIESPIEHL